MLDCVSCDWCICEDCCWFPWLFVCVVLTEFLISLLLELANGLRLKLSLK